jgi:DNA-binding MurR/RpiR family transcriptional regulator
MATVQPTFAPESVADRLDRVLPELSAQERRAALHLRAHYPIGGLDSLARVARAAGVSPQTVLRLTARLGFEGYRPLQDALRRELADGGQTPLGRLAATRPAMAEGDWLDAFGRTVVSNIEAAFERTLRPEFEAAAAALADRRRPVAVIGGRFTHSLAALLVRHLAIVRENVHEITGPTVAWSDRLIDVGRRTIVVAYDIRRYQSDVLRFLAAAVEQRATVILFTDSPAAPGCRHATHTLIAPVESNGAWDSLSALLALSEALMARTTDLLGAEAAERLARLEQLRARMIDPQC